MTQYRNWIKILVMVLCFHFYHCSEPIVQLPITECNTESEDYAWYIIAHGQSNVNTPETSVDGDGVYIYTQDSFYISQIKMVSSWVGKLLYEETGRPAFIVNVAEGGSTLNKSAKLDWNSDSEDELLDSLKEMHTDAYSLLSEKYSNIKSIHLWIHGQGDDNSYSSANKYQDQELEMLLELRQHFGSSVSLAIYDVNRFVDSVPDENDKITGSVINASKMKNADFLLNTWYIDTLDPPVETLDGVHWTNEGGKEDAARRALVEMGKI